MKKRFDIKRLVALLLCVILSANLLCATVFASEPIDANKAAEWELSEDALSLKNGSKTYFYYDIYLDNEHFMYPFSTYEYNEEIQYESDSGTLYLTVFSYARDGEIVWLEYNHGEIFAVYVTDEGKRIADDFTSGKYSAFRLFDQSEKCSTISDDLFNKLDAAYPANEGKISLDVTLLRDLDKYRINAFDSTDTLVYSFGIIYSYNDALYYVEHKDLPNNYFTADGSFSYRKGTVDAVILTGDLKEDVLASIEALEHPEFEYDYEESDAFLGIVAFLFIACIAVAGFIAPIALGILGICLARSKKAGYPKHWYILSITSLVWLVAAALLIIILLIAA